MQYNVGDVVLLWDQLRLVLESKKLTKYNSILHGEHGYDYWPEDLPIRLNEYPGESRLIDGLELALLASSGFLEKVADVREANNRGKRKPKYY